jgi:hypothetical protein
MPRTTRLIINDETAVYHVMSRTALDGFPLGDIETPVKCSRGLPGGFIRLEGAQVRYALVKCSRGAQVRCARLLRKPRWNPTFSR